MSLLPLPRIRDARANFHASLLAGPLSQNEKGIPSIADSRNKKSILLSQALLQKLGTAEVQERIPGQSSGKQFEEAVVHFLKSTFEGLSHLRPGQWQTNAGGASIGAFEQYGHLEELAKLADSNPEVKAALGGDYLIKPDVVILRIPEGDDAINTGGPFIDESCANLSPLRLQNNQKALLHASISCKWTLRSDRAQNARTEALNLIRNRKGRVPHIVAVTAEPLPSRLSSLALGTADLDCVYHFALPELLAANDELGYRDDEVLEMLVAGKRLRDISDLPLDLTV